MKLPRVLTQRPSPRMPELVGFEPRFGAIPTLCVHQPAEVVRPLNSAPAICAPTETSWSMPVSMPNHGGDGDGAAGVLSGRRGGAPPRLQAAATPGSRGENFAPGTMERLQLSPQRLLEHNPRLIVARGKGYGSTGPYAHMSAMDITVQAMSGSASATGVPTGRRPRPAPRSWTSPAASTCSRRSARPVPA